MLCSINCTLEREIIDITGSCSVHESPNCSNKYDGYEGSYCCYNQSACSDLAYGHYINYRCIQTCTKSYYGQ